jgi:cell division protein FtsB
VIRVRPTRVLAIGAIALVAFLYWKPLHTYARTKHNLQASQSSVRVLKTKNAKLEQQIAAANTAPELIKQARLLGLVRPGEQLFLVRGIAAWRHHNN